MPLPYAASQIFAHNTLSALFDCPDISQWLIMRNSLCRCVHEREGCAHLYTASLEAIMDSSQTQIYFCCWKISLGWYNYNGVGLLETMAQFEWLE